MERKDYLVWYAKQHYVPILLDESKDFILNFCKEKEFQNILEIGTAIGYSGSQFLAVCKNAKLTTIEIKKELFDIAVETFKIENLSDRVSQLLGDAKDCIANLPKESYDMIFLDGPKGQYYKYLPILITLLKRGGYLISDNIYFKGQVKKQGFIERKHRTIVNNLRKYIEDLKLSENLITEFYDIGDGISISQKVK